MLLNCSGGFTVCNHILKILLHILLYYKQVYTICLFISLTKFRNIDLSFNFEKISSFSLFMLETRSLGLNPQLRNLLHCFEITNIKKQQKTKQKLTKYTKDHNSSGTNIVKSLFYVT